MKDKGLLLVISGPAGSGKGTVIKMLMERDGDFAYSVSATTRAPRPGEVDGKNYYFVTREEFEERIRSGGMIEHTSYCGNFYGTPKKEAEEMLRAGKNLILEIEVEGALNVKRLYPEAVMIMLLPPSFATQEERLRGRGTETEEKVLLRLERTKEELKELSAYDYIVYNRDGGAQVSAEDIISIVRAEKLKQSRNADAFEKYFN